MNLSYITWEQQDQVDWLGMHLQPHLRACFHRPMMKEMRDTLQTIVQQRSTTPDRLAHVIMHSNRAGAFNLGGDLELFAQLIREQNAEQLRQYGYDCVDSVCSMHHHFNGNFQTIALVQGDALGGGMEMALACQVIVAEEHAKMGFPEVLFGLFPGMGAYSLLCQRVAPHLAERLILEGQIFTAHEMKAMGIVDVVVPRGCGREAVDKLIKQHQRIPLSYMALGHIRRNTTHVTREELHEVVDVWVDTALKLPMKSLKMMERLVKAQEQKCGALSSSSYLHDGVSVVLPDLALPAS